MLNGPKRVRDLKRFAILGGFTLFWQGGDWGRIWGLLEELREPAGGFLKSWRSQDRLCDAS